MDSQRQTENCNAWWLHVGARLHCMLTSTSEPKSSGRGMTVPRTTRYDNGSTVQPFSTSSRRLVASQAKLPEPPLALSATRCIIGGLASYSMSLLRTNEGLAKLKVHNQAENASQRKLRSTTRLFLAAWWMRERGQAPGHAQVLTLSPLPRHCSTLSGST